MVEVTGKKLTKFQSKKIEKLATSAKSAVETLEENFENSEALDLELLERKYELFKNEIDNIEEADETHEHFIDELIELDLRIKNLSMRMSEKNNSTIQLKEFNRNNINFLKIKIEKFEGDVTKWQNFWCLYELNIAENNELTKLEKFHYLLGLLEGEPKEILTGIYPIEKNFDLAIKILKEKYSDKNKIIQIEYNKLSYNQCEQLIHFVKKFRKSIRT